MRTKLILLATALLATVPAAADAGHAFRNETMAGLRCRLSTETNNTAMTIQLEPMELVTVMNNYIDIRCGGPVLPQRFALADGKTYVFRRLPDGNRIGLTPE
ncbi:hypothetical protein [Sandarakinorhabdus sp.]|jgi:hypothetical protein|uniref:hypothetical protein n=1 Tax=Sandarakinorhabdus sp. TaxID=1916663 RepID=UPI0033408BB2